MLTLQKRNTFLFLSVISIFMSLKGSIPCKEIGDSLISSYGIVEDKQQKSSFIVDQKEKLNFSIPVLSKQEKLVRFFSLTTNIDALLSSKSNNKFDSTSGKQLLEDLAILHGQPESKDIHLTGILNNCVTTMGEAALALKLAQKINSGPQCQALIKELVRNQDLADRLEASLIKIKEQENELFAILGSEDPALKEWARIVFFSKGFDRFNKYPLLHECTIRMYNLMSAGMLAYIPFLIAQTKYEAKKHHGYKDLSLFAEFIQALNSVNPYYYYKATQNIAKTKQLLSLQSSGEIQTDLATKLKNQQNEVIEQAVTGAIFALLQPFMANGAYNFFTTLKNFINNLHAKIIGVAQVVNCSKDFSILADQYPILKESLDLYPEIEKLLGTQENNELEYLIKLLQTNTFKGQASFFSFSGRVLTAHRLMQDHKEAFIPAMLAIGELDACLAIAKLIKKFENKRVGYCFVEFVEDETPYLKLEDYWNPFVNPETVVTNSIEFGGQQPRAIIVTGSNTGGKSTNLKAIMISVLLARTFGIAPARSATMTPFAYMGTSMNVSDNTAKGDSLFQAEVKRAERLVNTIDALRDEFGILIIDELFTGTAVEKGTVAAKRVAEHLAKSQNAILILATHFPELTKLEQETNLFKNYKVDVYKDEQGNLVRPFKLEPGVSTSNIADDILHEHLSFLTA